MLDRVKNGIDLLRDGLRSTIDVVSHSNEFIGVIDDAVDESLLEELLRSYDDSGYPQGFLDEYDIMECLAERNGVDTFVVQDRDGSKGIAKCYDRSVWSFDGEENILSRISGEGIEGLPRFIRSYADSKMLITVREYIEGMSLDRYAAEHDLSTEQITDICIQICDTLAVLHHREEPVIHRDIKPQNIIVAQNEEDEDTSANAGGKLRVILIDFDIARIYRSGNDTDTRFFGTMAYAPPEQYGFSQTDARADIYALGILLRYLLTGSTRENKNIAVYKPLAKIISKCTSFDPDNRYYDVDQVRKALGEANPKAQRIRRFKIAVCAVLAAALLGFTGYQIHRAVTWTPFNDESIPAFTSDSERVDDAVSYMNEKFDTDMFSGTYGTLEGRTGSDSVATIGLLKKVLTDIYDLDADYVNAPNTDMPQESEDYFLPWTWADDQTIDRDVMVYTAIKVYDPSIVADWSELEDDNGEYPGTRVALAFAEKTGIMTGVNRPGDITVGEMALILANTDRVFKAAKEASN